MNILRESRCRHDQIIEKNANVPQGDLISKHSDLKYNDKKQSFNNIFANGNTAYHHNSSHQQHSKIDPTATKPPLLDIPSPDVIQKRLLQLSAAFSRTQLSTLFDFSCLNNGTHNNFVHQNRFFSTYFNSATTSTAISRLSVVSETNSNLSYLESWQKF